MPRAETDLSIDFRHSLAEWGRANNRFWWYKKLRDDGEQQPFDAIMFAAGKGHAIEFKMVRSKKVWNIQASFKNRLHQIANLRRVEQSGGDSHVLVNHFRGRGQNDLYHISVLDCQLLLDAGTSHNIEDLVKEGILVELPLVERGIWNLGHLFKAVPKHCGCDAIEG